MVEKKYIEVNELFKTVEDYARTHPVMHDNELFALFCSVPAADVRPVVRGKWKRNERGNYICSNCKSEHNAVFGFIFCPNCGADMRGRADGTTQI